MRAYFNGATCTDYCPLNTVIRIEHLPEVVSLDTNVVKTFSKNSLDFLKTNYQAASICTEAVVPCGNNNKMETIINDNNKPSLDFNVFPNPASENIQVYFQLSEESNVSLFITDLSGRNVKSILNNKQLASGTHQMEILSSDLPSGIYQCILVQNDQTKHVKLIIEH
jgi:type IX secretion system substrate protein